MGPLLCQRDQNVLVAEPRQNSVSLSLSRANKTDLESLGTLGFFQIIALAPSTWSFLHIFRGSCSTSCPYTHLPAMGKGKEGMAVTSFQGHLLPIDWNIATWPDPTLRGSENHRMSQMAMSPANLWRFVHQWERRESLFGETSSLSFPSPRRVMLENLERQQGDDVVIGNFIASLDYWR